MASRLVQALSHAARKAPLLDVASSAAATRDFTPIPPSEAVGEDVSVEVASGADAIPQARGDCPPRSKMRKTERRHRHLESFSPVHKRLNQAIKASATTYQLASYT